MSARLKPIIIVLAVIIGEGALLTSALRIYRHGCQAHPTNVFTQNYAATRLIERPILKGGCFVYRVRHFL